MTQDMSFGDVCAWLRRQAKRFGDMATEIESTFGKMPMSPTTEQRTQFTSETDLVGRVKSLIGDGSMRPATIAQQLGVRAGQIDRVLTVENGFRHSTRGWWSVASSNGEHIAAGQTEEP